MSIAKCEGREFVCIDEVMSLHWGDIHSGRNVRAIQRCIVLRNLSRR
jgi:hypothetical protein